MKRILRWIGAFVGVALLGFGIGFFLQWSKAREAAAARESCETSLAEHAKRSGTQETLLSLYRARVEIGRNNFGLAGDHLRQAKTRAEATGIGGPSLASIERAADLVAANDAAAIDPIQQAIGSLEGTNQQAP